MLSCTQHEAKPYNRPNRSHCIQTPAVNTDDVVQDRLALVVRVARLMWFLLSKGKHSA